LIIFFSKYFFEKKVPPPLTTLYNFELYIKDSFRVVFSSNKKDIFVGRLISLEILALPRILLEVIQLIRSFLSSLIFLSFPVFFSVLLFFPALYSLPIAVTERCFATYFLEDYEKKQRSFLGYILVNSLNYKLNKRYYWETMSRKRGIRAYSLGERYQIAENIRACQVRCIANF
uniref:Ycf1 n=1 Tax=Haemonchus placei TaxID=6290 RepID=A0A0N4WUP4_HAEPC